MKTYRHFVWNPFATMQFHLFIFESGRSSRKIVWNKAFGLNYKDQDDPSVGECYFLNDHSVENVAVALEKLKDGSIDIATIVHECNHASDEYFKILSMKMEDGQSTHEFRSNLSGSLVSKIIQILEHIDVKINHNIYDQLGLMTVLEKVGNKYVHIK